MPIALRWLFAVAADTLAIAALLTAPASRTTILLAIAVICCAVGLVSP